MDTIKQLTEAYAEHIGEIIDRWDGKRGPRFNNPGKYLNAPLPKSKDGTYKNINVEDWQKVWVWSDLHLGHKNIIRFSDRPFANTDDMEYQLIENFNDHVGLDDISIWVGDVAFQADSETNRILRQLNGYKILVIGNHDFNHKKLRKLDFDETHLVYFAESNEVDLAFTHFPMFKIPEDWINVHGHAHIGDTHWTSDSVRHINVNLEFHDYKPITLENIHNWAKMRKIAMEK